MSTPPRLPYTTSGAPGSPAPPPDPLEGFPTNSVPLPGGAPSNPWDPGAGMGYEDVLESIFGRMNL